MDKLIPLSEIKRVMLEHQQDDMYDNLSNSEVQWGTDIRWAIETFVENVLDELGSFRISS